MGDGGDKLVREVIEDLCGSGGGQADASPLPDNRVPEDLFGGVGF